MLFDVASVLQEGANGNSLLDTPNSQGRESFLDDSDTENAGTGVRSAAESLRTALATGSRGAGVWPVLHSPVGLFYLTSNK